MLQAVSSFKGPQFLKLRAQWNKKLEEEGFPDIEDTKQRLKQWDRRTQAFEDMEMVFEFFYRLDHFLTEHENDPHIPAIHKKILHFYAQGMKLVEIVREVRVSLATVKRIITPYRQLITDQIVSRNPHNCSDNVIEIRNDELKMDN